MDEEASMRKTEQTQWAATYLVAAELTKRGYRVGWPMGNAPTKDLLVESPEGKQFDIDVKGGCYKPSQSSYWHPVQETRVQGNPLSSLFFVFVRVDPDPDKSSEFFILSHQDLINLHQQLTQTMPTVSRKGTPYKPFPPGCRYQDPLRYKGLWNRLPP